MVIFNENLAKVAEKYLRKGAKVYLEGSLQTRKWTDKDGAEKYSTEVVLQRFNGTLVMLDGRGGEGGPATGGRQRGSCRPSSATRWMTRSLSRLRSRLSCHCLAGCATSSGVAGRRYPGRLRSRPPISPFIGAVLCPADGAAMAIVPGIAVTNGHNRNLVDPEKRDRGSARTMTFCFSATLIRLSPKWQSHSWVKPSAPMARAGWRPASGPWRGARHSDLHRLHRACLFHLCRQCRPGFSGGPVLDGSGRLIGITFGYKDEDRPEADLCLSDGTGVGRTFRHCGEAK